MGSGLPNFRDYDNASRNEPYGWDYGHGAARVRVTFQKAKDKAGYKRAFVSRWYSERHAVLHFDSEEWREVQRLKECLGSNTLKEAVDFFLQNRGAAKEVPLLSELLVDRLADLERTESASKSHSKLYVEKFISYAGDRRVDLYERKDVQKWIDSIVECGAKRNTVKGNLNQVKKLFSDALTDGMIAKSPATRITLPTTRGEKRTTLIDPEHLDLLLRRAWDADRPMAGLLAILFFTGMRISMVAVPPRKRNAREYLRLDMIDRTNRTIIVPAGIMKSEADLLIDDAPECLWGWLEELSAEDFGMAQNTFNLRKNKLLDSVGFVWPANLHRRSFGSYLAALRGRDYAAQMMGDRTESVFVKHYQVPAFKHVAAGYVAIYR